jgi:hypothetical protein
MSSVVEQCGYPSGWRLATADRVGVLLHIALGLPIAVIGITVVAVTGIAVVAATGIAVVAVTGIAVVAVVAVTDAVSA